MSTESSRKGAASLIGMPSGGTSTVELMMLSSGQSPTERALSCRPRRRSERLNGSSACSAAAWLGLGLGLGLLGFGFGFGLG